MLMQVNTHVCMCMHMYLSAHTEMTDEGYRSKQVKLKKHYHVHAHVHVLHACIERVTTEQCREWF